MIELKDYDMFHGSETRHDEKFVKSIFIPYFTDIFKDLAERSKADNEPPGINRMTFLDYVRMPGIIGQRLFQIADQNKDGILDIVEFRKIMQKVYYSRLETKM